MSITVTGGSPGTKIYSANAPATFTTVPPSGKLVIVALYVTSAVSPTGISGIVNPICGFTPVAEPHLSLHYLERNQLPEIAHR